MYFISLVFLFGINSIFDQFILLLFTKIHSKLCVFVLQIELVIQFHELLDCFRVIPIIMDSDLACTWIYVKLLETKLNNYLNTKCIIVATLFLFRLRTNTCYMFFLWIQNEQLF